MRVTRTEVVHQAAATRAQVYQAIDNERRYQDQLPETRRVNKEHSVGDYLVLMAYYLQKAQASFTTQPGNDAALHDARKLAAVAVACMEDHGALEREW